MRVTVAAVALRYHWLSLCVVELAYVPMLTGCTYELDLHVKMAVHCISALSCVAAPVTIIVCKLAFCQVENKDSIIRPPGVTP